MAATTRNMPSRSAVSKRARRQWTRPCRASSRRRSDTSGETTVTSAPASTRATALRVRSDRRPPRGSASQSAESPAEKNGLPGRLPRGSPLVWCRCLIVGPFAFSIASKPSVASRIDVERLLGETTAPGELVFKTRELLATKSSNVALLSSAARRYSSTNQAIASSMSAAGTNAMEFASQAGRIARTAADEESESLDGLFADSSDPTDQTDGGDSRLGAVVRAARHGNPVTRVSRHGGESASPRNGSQRFRGYTRSIRGTKRPIRRRTTPTVNRSAGRDLPEHEQVVREPQPQLGARRPRSPDPAPTRRRASCRPGAATGGRKAACRVRRGGLGDGHRLASPALRGTGSRRDGRTLRRQDVPEGDGAAPDDADCDRPRHERVAAPRSPGGRRRRRRALVQAQARPRPGPERAGDHGAKRPVALATSPMSLIHGRAHASGHTETLILNFLGRSAIHGSDSARA